MRHAWWRCSRSASRKYRVQVPGHRRSGTGVGSRTFGGGVGWQGAIDVGDGLQGVMRGGWKRTRVLRLPSLQCTAWTAADHSTTSPASYSTLHLGRCYAAAALVRRLTPVKRPTRRRAADLHVEACAGETTGDHDPDPRSNQRSGVPGGGGPRRPSGRGTDRAVRLGARRECRASPLLRAAWVRPTPGRFIFSVISMNMAQAGPRRERRQIP